MYENTFYHLRHNGAALVNAKKERMEIHSLDTALLMAYSASCEEGGKPFEVAIDLPDGTPQVIAVVEARA